MPAIRSDNYTGHVDAIMDSSNILKLKRSTQIKRRTAIGIFLNFLDSHQSGLGARFAYDKFCDIFDDLELWKAVIRYIMIPRKNADPLAYSTVSGMFIDILTSVQVHTAFRISAFDRKLLRKYMSSLIDLRPSPLKLPFAAEDFQRIVLKSYDPSVHFETAAHRIQFVVLILLIAFCGGRPGEFQWDKRLTAEDSRALQWKNVSFYVGVGASGETIFQALISFENLKSRLGSRKRMPLYEEQGSDKDNQRYLDPLWPLLALGLHDGVFKHVSSVEDLQGISVHGIRARDQGSIHLAIKEEFLDQYVFRVKRPTKSSEDINLEPLTYARGNDTLKRVSRACRFRDPLQFYDLRRFVGSALEMALVTPSDRSLIFGHACSSRTFDIAYKNSTSAVDLQSIAKSRDPNPQSAQIGIVRARYHGPLSPEQARRVKRRISQDPRVVEAQAAISKARSDLERMCADHQAKPNPSKKLLHTLAYVRRLAKKAETLVERQREDEEITERIIRGVSSPRTPQFTSSPPTSSASRSPSSVMSLTPEPFTITFASIPPERSLSPSPSPSAASLASSASSTSSTSTSRYQKKRFAEKAIDPACSDEYGAHQRQKASLAEYAAAITPSVSVSPERSPLQEVYDIFNQVSGATLTRFHVIHLMMAMLADDGAPKLVAERQVDCPVCDNNLLGKNSAKLAHIRTCTRNDLYDKYTSHASFLALYGDARPTRVSDLVEYCSDCESWFVGQPARAAHKLKHASKPSSDLDTRYFCPFCLYDQDHLSTTWRLGDQTSTRRHMNSQHILHKNCATRCPYPTCAFLGCGLDLALHLTDIHRASLFAPSSSGRTRKDLDLNPFTKLGGSKKLRPLYGRKPKVMVSDEEAVSNSSSASSSASSFKLVLHRASGELLSHYTRLSLMPAHCAAVQGSTAASAEADFTSSAAGVGSSTPCDRDSPRRR